MILIDHSQTRRKREEYQLPAPEKTDAGSGCLQAQRLPGTGVPARRELPYLCL